MPSKSIDTPPPLLRSQIVQILKCTYKIRSVSQRKHNNATRIHGKDSRPTHWLLARQMWVCALRRLGPLKAGSFEGRALRRMQTLNGAHSPSVSIHFRHAHTHTNGCLFNEPLTRSGSHPAFSPVGSDAVQH